MQSCALRFGVTIERPIVTRLIGIKRNHPEKGYRSKLETLK